MQPSGTYLLGRKSGRFNFLISKRTVAWCILLTIATTIIATFALSQGELRTSPTDLVEVAFGTAEQFTSIVILEWRLPRLFASLVFGAALGVSGALFQSLIRNPLGSPDIIGFNTGAYTGALVVIIVFGGSYFEVAFGAITGGLIAATAVYLLAYKQGIQGFRLIIIGIGIRAMLSAFNSWLMLTSKLETAMTAAIWGAGTLNGLGWNKILPSFVFIAVAFVISATLVRKLNLLEMGDDNAAMLGVSGERTRRLAMLSGVILTAAVTAATGPISFIALVAPQLARKLTKDGSVGLMASALMGAMLLTLSDFTAVNLFAPHQLPVGVITISIGGIYLLYLLIRQSERS
ncbi:iron-enterobactin ABC transporter permease [Vibrio alginolyticus]|nr:iron-enterobactin ABC transporter permease [Vibrio alginolyticus]